MPEPNKATLVGQLNAELDAVLSERPSLNLVFASDGAPHHWAVLDAMNERVATTCTGDRMKLADAFHVAEYVQKAATAIKGDGAPEASILSATWRETIKEMEDGAESVLRSNVAARRPRLGVTARKDLDAARSCIATQHQLGRMKYAEAREKNYPIGTGITEAAAKTVVGTRMKRAGARFSQHGGQTIMLFRTALLSDRFEALHAEARGDLHGDRESHGLTCRWWMYTTLEQLDAALNAVTRICPLASRSSRRRAPRARSLPRSTGSTPRSSA